MPETDNEEGSPIDDLYTDAGPFDVVSVVNALKPYLAIQRDSNAIILKNNRNASVETRVLSYMLAKKLLATDGRIETPYVSAAEFHKETGTKKGSVDSEFKKLREEGLISGGGSQYEIPNYAASDVVEILVKKANQGEK